MTTHVVPYRERPEVTQQAAVAIAERLGPTREPMPQIRIYHVGTDLGLREDNMPFGGSAFDAQASLEFHLTDTDHQSVIEASRPLVGGYRVIEFRSK